VRVKPTRSWSPALALLILAVACGCSAPERARSTAVRLLDHPTPVTIGNETRLALVVEPGALTAVRRFGPIVLPSAALLSLGFGVPGQAIGGDGAATRVSIHLETRDGTRHTLLKRRLDPRGREAQSWVDADLDLSRWSGLAVTFELSASAVNARRAPLATAWSDPVVHSAQREPAPPNILIVSIDTLRARSVGAYGYGRDTTPFIDALAEQGTLFEKVITPSVTTAPSHMSLFTGLYPEHHGMRTGMDSKTAGSITAAARFRAAGYHTAAFTENGFILRPNGFGEGFSEYTEYPGRKLHPPGRVQVTFAQARRWLRRNRRRPFFLFAHTYQVHAPYRPPAPYADLFANDDFPGPEDPAMRRLRDDYDREIRFVDDWLAELVAALDALGLRESTLLLVLADHGEEFAEHGSFQHGSAVFDEALEVPLILNGPGVAAGRRIATPVSLIDVTPTLLDLAGLPVPEGLDGTSLAAAIRGSQALAERTFFAEARAPVRFGSPFISESWNPPLIAVRSHDEKFIVHRPEEGEARPAVRYDLAADALERAPQPVEGEALRAVDALVDAYLAGGVAPTEDRADTLTPAERENLRLLGYID
jgi:arylsulfatase A-like enzyme